MHLERLAHYDATTGLPNRHFFNRQIALQMVSALAQNTRLGLMFIDLDNFKFVNDTLGHQVGDDLLCLTGERISATLRRDDTLCRLGGDEFAVILKDIAEPEDAGTVARKIIDTLTAPMLLSGHEVYIGASIGVAICPDHASQPEALLRGADTAMYQAKAKGKNNHQYFHQEMEGKAQHRLAMETSLRKAVERSELLLHYQPQFDMEQHKMIGLEALLRWQHPQHGLLKPADFIPLAEETGLVIPIGDWVLETASRQARLWKLDERGIALAVNVSGRQIQEDKFSERVADILARTGFDPRWLELELTESVFMKQSKVVHQLDSLKRLGLSLTIDDFGTGHSSLSYLKRFPIAKLKIGRSFIKDLPHSRDDIEISKAIIAVAHNLHMNVVAEGVETQAQMECLRENGCPLIQGHFISPPLQASEISDTWLRLDA
jgi:diguanylate cyclase (GGDEF)-like protein